MSCIDNEDLSPIVATPDHIGLNESMAPTDTLPPQNWTLETLQALGATRLHRDPPALPDLGPQETPVSPSDFDLNPDMKPLPEERGQPAPAAVLIPVVARSTLTMILTERTRHLARHAGQIAFPGGRIDASDADARAAALREAEEEIGLDRKYVTALGYLDPYLTRTGFAVTPLVALIESSFSLSPDPGEVADVFEIPFDFAMNTANISIQSVSLEGRPRHFYVIEYENRYIWGATAGIIRNMHKRLLPA